MGHSSKPNVIWELQFLTLHIELTVEWVGVALPSLKFLFRSVSSQDRSFLLSVLVVFSVCVDKWVNNLGLAAHPFCSSLSINHIIRCFVIGIIIIDIEEIKNKLLEVETGYPDQQISVLFLIYSL